jgi:hypothetical protein
VGVKTVAGFRWRGLGLIIELGTNLSRHGVGAEIAIPAHHPTSILESFLLTRCTERNEVRWVGIDEAGYGPNLGPLVMTAVVAEDRERRPADASGDLPPAPDLWRDLAATIDRAGGDMCRVWVDDSKAILRGGKGRDRLEAGCLALLDALAVAPPRSIEDLLGSLGAGTLEDAELSRWIEPEAGNAACPWYGGPLDAPRASVPNALIPPDEGWRIVGVRTIVIGPARFNGLLSESGSKARVHFAAFRELLHLAWALSVDGLPTHLEGDKHGGRHYYLEPLVEALPDTWIDRGPEGPALSRYVVRSPGRRMTVSLTPRADGTNGLVSLASIVSKVVRELWMDQFNAFWTRRIEGLRPTAGYPVDAARFRAAIEPLARELAIAPELWWRQW